MGQLTESTVYEAAANGRAWLSATTGHAARSTNQNWIFCARRTADPSQLRTARNRQQQTRKRAVQATRSLSVITTIAIFAATSEQILMAVNMSEPASPPYQLSGPCR